MGHIKCSIIYPYVIKPYLKLWFMTEFVHNVLFVSAIMMSFSLLVHVCKCMFIKEHI